MSRTGFSAVEQKIEPILSAGHHYDYGQTPAAFFATPPELRTTTNCKDIGHQALEQLRGIRLPVETQIVEAHFSPDAPDALFSRVHPTEALRVGDWIMLGRPATTAWPFEPQFDTEGVLQNWEEFDINHLAVYLGEFRGDSMLLHATLEADGAVVSTLKQATAHRRTSVIHDVLRATQQAA